MMYNNQLAFAVKVNGKVLREFKDTVYIPFGSEYSLLIKNLNTVRTLVNISIDGQDAVPGGLVLDANSEIDLERFVKDKSIGNRFKFIERSGKIEENRGVKLEDGLIRIEYQFEKVFQRQDGIQWINHHTHGYSRIPPATAWYGSGSGMMFGSSTLSATACNAPSPTMSFNAQAELMRSATQTKSLLNETGITVPGSESTQKFVEVKDFPLQPEKHAMVIKLLGETPDNKEVRQPVTVKAKPKCQTCGKLNKATAKFCTECGTALTVYA
jgi:hypothetical protein